MRLMIGAAALGLLAQAAAPQPGIRLPAAALRAAADGPIPLAYAIARFGIPAGFVTSDNPSAASFASVVDGLDAPRTVPLQDVIAQFQIAHPDYAVTSVRGVLSIVKLISAARPPSKRASSALGTMRSDMSRLLVHVSWLATDGTEPMFTGVLAGGRVGELPRQGLPPLEATFPAGPIRQALDDIVRLNQGGAWIVWEHHREDGRDGCRVLGYFQNGDVGASSKDFIVLPPSGTTRSSLSRPSSSAVVASNANASRARDVSSQRRGWPSGFVSSQRPRP